MLQSTVRSLHHQEHFPALRLIARTRDREAADVDYTVASANPQKYAIGTSSGSAVSIFAKIIASCGSRGAASHVHDRKESIVPRVCRCAACLPSSACHAPIPTLHLLLREYLTISSRRRMKSPTERVVRLDAPVRVARYRRNQTSKHNCLRQPWRHRNTNWPCVNAT